MGTPLSLQPSLCRDRRGSDASLCGVQKACQALGHLSLLWGFQQQAAPDPRGWLFSRGQGCPQRHAEEHGVHIVGGGKAVCMWVPQAPAGDPHADLPLAPSADGAPQPVAFLLHGPEIPQLALDEDE